MATRALAFALMLLALSCGGAQRKASLPAANMGQAIVFSLPSDAGALVTVPLPGARATVLDFFAPTCLPCREKLPKLLAARGEIEGKGATIVLVAVLSDAETSDDARRALESWGVQSSFLVDKGGVSRSEAGVEKLPATLVLDARGILRWVAPPDATEVDIAAAVP